MILVLLFAQYKYFAYLQVCHNTSLASLPPNRAYPDGGPCLKWDMLTQKSLLLPVTCYRRGRNAVSSTFAMPSLCPRYAFAVPSLFRLLIERRKMGSTSVSYRIYNGFITELHLRELVVLAESHWSLYLFCGRFWNGFHVLLKEKVHIVIAIEINGIIVTGASLHRFQAYWIRWISQELMLIVMLLRLSATYIQLSNHI